MKSSKNSYQYQHALTFGAAIVTLLIATQSNSDPVNVPKLTALGALGGLSLAFVIREGLVRLFDQNKFLLTLCSVFVGFLFYAGFASGAPFSQSFYGVYGRNNGILTYSLLTFILLGVTTLKSIDSITLVIRGLLFVGVVNVSYCGWVLAFGDFVGWQNPYKHILGTFGNPDFISAFLGIFIAVVLSFIFSKKMSVRQKAALGIAATLALYEIEKSKAIQGLVIVALAVLVITGFLVRSRSKNIVFTASYLFFSAAMGIIAVLGTLQKGPWTFLYKKSVSLRGSYWHAGIQMGLDNPLTGVGPEAYGDWYRRTRPPVALVDTPGINTMSNVSHNVFIDFFAYGGFPLGILYLALTSVGVYIIAKNFIKQRTFDPVFVAIATAWICYQAQSVISINQIGLALWGWILLGLLIAYENLSKEPKEESSQIIPKLSSKNVGGKKTNVLLTAPTLIGTVLGLLIASPPMLADMKWQKALEQRNLQMVEGAMKPSYFNPANSTKYANATNLLLVNKYKDKAIALATEAVRFNRDSFDSWKQLYFITDENNPLHTTALENMKRLDPLNPDVTAP